VDEALAPAGFWDDARSPPEIRCVTWDTRPAAEKITAAGMPEAHARRPLQ
jgi:hypothetical protein